MTAGDLADETIAALSLAEVADAIAAGRLTSVAATQACLERIARWQPVVNAFIALDAEGALAEAAARDRERAEGRLRGKLHGVPLAHKDMFYRAGQRSTAGSKIRSDFAASVTSTVLQRLDNAGAVTLGTLNMAEFAAGPTGHNIFYGDCCNPWNPAHLTGGSSSGSGASVAARLVYGALGSDTGGSVRLPAAACGLVGLKPTWGRISRHGGVMRAWSLDCFGPLTRTARDNARMLSIVAGADPADPTASRQPVPDYEAALERPIDGLRIGVAGGPFREGVAAEVLAAQDAALEVLHARGAKLVPVVPPDLDPLWNLGDTISKSEAAAAHMAWIQERPEDYSPQVFARAEVGLHIPAARYLHALALRGCLLRAFADAVFAKADLLVMPVMPFPVPTRAATDVQVAGDVPAMVGAMTRFTRPINYLGLPAISIPCGFDEAGLPLAFQLVGRPFGEARLLRTAHAYQQSTDWHEVVPALGREVAAPTAAA